CAAPLTLVATTVNGNGSYPSLEVPASAGPGTYRWVAAYDGDANNNPATTACGDLGESTTVTKASPTITTSATATATAGGVISDTATLAGGFGPTGTITFNLFGPNNVTCAGIPAFTSTKAVVSGISTYTSDGFIPLAAGAYSWIAAYNGDANNNAATSACIDPAETSTVSKASPTITSTATASANTGGTISDTATLAGGVATTGAITFTLFGPNNATCSGTALFTSTKPVSGNGTYPSDPFIPVSSGTYYWVASYSGDLGNSTATTACGDPGETSTVTQVNSQDVSLRMFRVGRFSTGHRGVFIVLVSNTGTVDTSGRLTFTDTLPVGLTFVDSFSFDWHCSAAGQTVTCTYDNPLPVGRFTGLVLIVDVTAPRGTVLTNTGTVTPSDATPADNTASVTVTVRGGRHDFEGNFEGNFDQNDEATLQE
ncbi:MAG TPA: hypothetical protein VGU71_01370, partial [Candidatus Dormibacteraeota bacterium]|nr:hypothetical protein [Candidatus Dormibacteraeota bacterium]